jgi:hypothetical protein
MATTSNYALRLLASLKAEAEKVTEITSRSVDCAGIKHSLLREPRIHNHGWDNNTRYSAVIDKVADTSPWGCRTCFPTLALPSLMPCPECAAIHSPGVPW